MEKITYFMCLVATLKITLKALYIVDDCGGNWVSGDKDKNVANVFLRYDRNSNLNSHTRIF